MLSSEDMYLSGGHGKCMKILHVYGDKLCNQVWSIPPRPAQGTPDLNDLSDMWNTMDTADKKNSDENESEILRSKLDELDIDKTSNDTVPNDESISDNTTTCKVEISLGIYIYLQSESITFLLYFFLGGGGGGGRNRRESR